MTQKIKIAVSIVLIAGLAAILVFSLTQTPEPNNHENGTDTDKPKPPPDKDDDEVITVDETIPADATITIDATKSGGQKPLTGFLLGYRKEVGLPGQDLVAALKPSFWRADWDYGIVKTAKSVGAKTTWVVGDNSRKGDTAGYTDCSIGPWSDNFVKYKSFVKTQIKAAVVNNEAPDYWDFWAEPDDYAWFGTQAQMFATFKAFSEAVREVEQETGKPQKIVAPSIANIEGSAGASKCGLSLPRDGRTFKIEDFISFVAKNNLKLDAISWHIMNTDPAGQVQPQVSKIRKLLQDAGLCKTKCPEIHINEYQASQAMILPGNNLAFWYYLEKANVDWASKACWVIGAHGSPPLDGCWESMNGVFMGDNKTPQALYWLFKAYAELNEKSRLQVVTTDSRTIALASKNDAKKEVKIIVGRYCHLKENGKLVEQCFGSTYGADARVRIKIMGYEYANTAIVVKLYRIPQSGNIPKAMPNPPTQVSSQNILP